MRKMIIALLCLMLALSLPCAGLAEGSNFTDSGFQYTLNEDGSATIAGYTGDETRLVLPATLGEHPVTAIGNEAFMNKGQLQHITLPEGVTAVGMKVFFSCAGLADVNLPGSLLTIGDFAFAYCVSLERVTIPEGTQTIGKFAFGGCGALRQASLPGSVTFIDPEAFDEVGTDFRFLCAPESYARGYAKENDIAFWDEDSDAPDESTDLGDMPVSSEETQPEHWAPSGDDIGTREIHLEISIGQEGQNVKTILVLTGEAEGFGGTVRATVTLEDGRIVKVEAIGKNETEDIGAPALLEISEKIVREGSADVDVLAGATYTSEAVIMAVKNAMATLVDYPDINIQTSPATEKPN